MKYNLHKLMAMFIASIFAVSAYADVNLTSRVGTEQRDWQLAHGGVPVMDGISMPENYQQEGDVNTTGDVLWQEVTGLPNGTYKVEVWANARVAWVNSPATDGQENCVYIFANNVEKSIQILLNPNTDNNASHVLDDVEVTNGTLKMGMIKRAGGSNWHTMQIKSLTLKGVDSDAFVAEMLAGASVDNPVKTDFVVGGTMYDVSHWTSTTGADNKALADNQKGAFTGKFYENWHPNNYTGKIYQVIENVPNGIYDLSICAFVETFDVSAQFVYANADKVALTTGAPTAYKVRTIVENNTIEVGFEQTAAVNRWCGIDNVSLTYLGEYSDDADLNIAKAAFTAAYDEFGAALMACQAQMFKMNFYEVDDAAYQLNENLESATVETLNEMVAMLNEATASLNEMNEVYAEYNVYVQKFQAAMGFSEPLTTEAAELLQYHAAGYGGAQVMTVDALKQAIQFIKEDYVTYAGNAKLYDGNMFDFTYLIQNPNFDKNMDGWTTETSGWNGGEGYNGVGGLAEIANWGASSWTASISQTLNGLPNGKYIVKASWMAASGIEMVFAANAGEAKVVGVGDTGGNIAKDGSVVEMGQGYRGWQYVEVEGVVEDGTLAIVARSSAQVEHVWSNADAFELYYAGAVAEEEEPVVAPTLDGTYFSIGAAATTLEVEKWYLLKNQGRNAYISEQTTEFKMKNAGELSTVNSSDANKGLLFKLVKGEADGQYSIVSGNGLYLSFVQDGSTPSESPVDYIIGSIADGVWYMQDPVSKVVADGNPAGYNFVGWGSSVPTSTGGNNAYEFLEAAIFDEATMETLDKAANFAYDLQVTYGLVSDASQFSSNAPETQEGSFGALIDGEYTTFFHSAWSYQVEGAHHLQVEVSEPVESFSFYFKKRSQNNANRPTDITILGSNDGNDFVEIATINSGLPTDGSDLDYTSPLITAQEAYKHFRFVVNSTSTNTAFFTFSEFYLLPADKAEALAAAQAVVAAGPAAENFDELAEKFELVYANVQTDKFNKLFVAAVADAEALLAAATHAEVPAIGQYATASYEKFQATIDVLKAEATQENLEAINAAIVDFNAAKNLPYFVIEGAASYSTGKAIYDNPGNVNAKGNSHYFKEIDTTDKSMLWALDITETVAGVMDAVKIRNVGTGAAFWGCQTINITETDPSDPEDGIFLFYTTDNGTPIHAQNDGQLICRWNAKDAASGSAWKFTYVGNTYDLTALPEVDENDYTSCIVNADLATGEGWNTDGVKSVSDGMAKVSSGATFNFCQTISLPAGQYKMTAKAAYRYGADEQAEYNAIEAGDETHLVKLYAETATYKYEGNVQNRYEGASETDYAAGEGSVTVNSLFVPNSSNAVKAWFDADQYVNVLVFNVQEDGEIKIGIANVGNNPGGEYTNIGAWTLTRLGDAEADPETEEPGDDPTGIESVESQVETVIYDLSGRRVQTMTKGLYIVNGRKVVVK